jgi:hypothetical protein
LISNLKVLSNKLSYNYEDEKSDVISIVLKLIWDIKFFLDNELYNNISNNKVSNNNINRIILIKENFINIENLIKRESREIKHINNVINLVK